MGISHIFIIQWYHNDPKQDKRVKEKVKKAIKNLTRQTIITGYGGYHME